LQQFPQAIAEFQAAVRLNPSDSMAHTNLGAAMAETGDLAAAREHLQKALQLDPNNSLAQEDLREVERRLSEQAH
jgi:Flp pilus assembly protein TadD